MEPLLPNRKPKNPFTGNINAAHLHTPGQTHNSGVLKPVTDFVPNGGSTNG